MSVGSSRGGRKALRDIFQVVLATIATGGTAVLVEIVTDGMSPLVAVLIGIGYKFLVTYAQNRLETDGKIPVMLPTPGLVPGRKEDGGDGGGGGGGGVAVAVGTVDAVAETVGDTVGEVTGTVTGVAGDLIGEVVDVSNLEEK